MYIQQLNQQIKQYIVSFWKKVRILFNVYNEKQLLSFFKWLDQFVEYLIKENSFDPERIPRLKKGDIIWVAFGHNVGSELGGPRPAIVLEFENHKKEKNIIVAPVRSYNSNGPKKFFPGLVYVGDSEFLSNNSYVDLKYIRAISKMRIIPQYNKSMNKSQIIIGRLTNEQLDKIDEELMKIFINPKLDK
jgi:mRNA interferase MazF